MVKIAALFVLTLSLLVGGTDFASAGVDRVVIEGWGGLTSYTQMVGATERGGAPNAYTEFVEGSRLIGGDDLVITSGRQTVSSEAPCITVDDLLTYQLNAPPPFPSARILGQVEGLEAREFLISTGGSAVAPFAGFVYFLIAPRERPRQVLALIADPEGCAILMNGERADVVGQSAGVPLSRQRLRMILQSLPRFLGV